jgi:hypothetical protein
MKYSQAVEKRSWVSLRAKRSNLVVNHFKHYAIASSLTLLAMTDKAAFFNSLLKGCDVLCVLSVSVVQRI